jgi:hypothetical protein
MVALLLSQVALAEDPPFPDTAIDSGPSDPTNDNTPTFSFSSDPAGASFECRVDSDNPDDFAACSGPGDTHTTGPLGDGPHTFDVRAVDAASNPDPTPATRTFTVETTAPQTTIDSGPSGLTNDNDPSFGFHSEAGATFECRLDGPGAANGSFAACNSPQTYTDLADGDYTFRVRATDLAANTEQPAATRTFTVDTTAPQTTIDSGPSGVTADPTPTFSFSSEPGAGFECRVDSESFAACSGPGDSHTTAELADGAHTFEVRAIDAASNPDPTPASRNFTVDTTGPPDTTPPDAAIVKRPKPTIKTKKRQVKVRASFTSEAGATFECRLDGGEFKPCTSPYTVRVRAGAGKGTRHVIAIRAIDQAGNVGSPEKADFKVLRSPRLRESVAQRTVERALQRHGFARRVVKALKTDCRRRARDEFKCSFEAKFPGYSLKGRGSVRLTRKLTYRFKVKAQGERFNLTDKNER